VWACDASLYTASAFTGPAFLLAGDAGAVIDPLSSYGVKKALGSAWMAAVALHTALVDAARQQVAFDFYADREREVYEADLARTREFARRAHAHHGHEFWAARSAAGGGTTAAPLDDRLLQRESVAAAHERLRSTPNAELNWGNDVRFTPRPVIRGREVVLEDAVTFGEATLRFAAGVDLTLLLDLARRHRGVPDLYDAYCRARGPLPLARFLAAVSLLLSENVMESRPSASA
jgi:hypothetical protein